MKNNKKPKKNQDHVNYHNDIELTQGLDIIQEQLTDTYTDGTVDRRIELEER